MKVLSRQPRRQASQDRRLVPMTDDVDAEAVKAGLDELVQRLGSQSVQRLDELEARQNELARHMQQLAAVVVAVTEQTNSSGTTRGTPASP